MRQYQSELKKDMEVRDNLDMGKTELGSRCMMNHIACFTQDIGVPSVITDGTLVFSNRSKYLLI